MFNTKDILPNSKEIVIEIKDINQLFISNSYIKRKIILNNLNTNNNKINVLFKLDINQIINIEKIMQGDKVIDFTFIINLSDPEIEILTEKNNKILKKNEEIDIFYEKINKLENLYYNFCETIEKEYYKELYKNEEIQEIENKMDSIYEDIENKDSSDDIQIINEHLNFFDIQFKDIFSREKKKKNIEFKLNKIQNIIEKNNSVIKDFNYEEFLKLNDFSNIENYDNNIRILDTEINKYSKTPP